jgi:hypothetical protein
MPRLSIDITAEQHQKLKATAALKGQSIKEFVLEKTIGDLPDTRELSEDEAWAKLSAFLKPRIEAADRGEFVETSFADIATRARKRVGLE